MESSYVLRAEREAHALPTTDLSGASARFTPIVPLKGDNYRACVCD